jgi:hypothetical protein
LTSTRGEPSRRFRTSCDVVSLRVVATPVIRLGHDGGRYPLHLSLLDEFHSLGERIGIVHHQVEQVRRIDDHSSASSSANASRAASNRLRFLSQRPLISLLRVFGLGVREEASDVLGIRPPRHSTERLLYRLVVSFVRPQPRMVPSPSTSGFVSSTATA